MENKKLLLLSIAMIVIIGGIFFSLYYSNSGLLTVEQEDQDQETELEGPEHLFREIELLFFNGEGTISWHLESSEISASSRENILELTAVNADVYEILDQDSITDQLLEKENFIEEELKLDSSNLKGIYDLNAEQGRYDMAQGKLELYGPIRITKKDISLDIGLLSLEDGAERIFAENGVSIRSADFVLNGEKLEGDFAFNSIVVTGSDNKQAHFSLREGSDSD